MRSTVVLAIWTILAGAGIPLIGVLNGGVARSIGNPLGATAVMFAVAFLIAAGLALPLYGLPAWGQLASAPGISYGAGFLIGFYALSATIIIPRFGAGNFIAFILVAQLATAAVIDQFGLFGIVRSPLGFLKSCGFALIVLGVVIMQLAGRKAVP
jgi:bacterial/archaeal transporter family-2 protein